MKLLIDIGNSRIKWQLRANGWASELRGTAYSSDVGSESLLSQWRSMEKPTSIWISNVAGETVRTSIQAWCQAAWALEPHFVVAAPAALGVRNGYEEPARLGVDRWLALIAAWNEFRTSACVVDCGTALTIDAINEQGEHLGGVIAAGPALLRGALVRDTVGIRPKIDGRFEFLARNTEDALTTGSVLAVVGCIDAFVANLKKRMPVECLIMTGGEADTIVHLLADRWHVIPQLVLDGLAAIAAEG
jgi:type III pantothenate kinase